LSFTEGPMVDKLRLDGFKTHVVHTEKPFNFRVWAAVQKIVADEKIELIHAHGTRANSNTFYAAKSLKIPLIYTVHGWSFHPDQSRFTKWVRILSERLLVSVADKTICVSESNLKEGRGKFPMPRAMVILNGVNQIKFNPDRKYKNIRAELGIEENIILVGYVARITAQKAPLTFLRAIAEVPETLPVKFLIVGDGDLKPRVLELAKELKLNSRIVFEDFRSDIPDVLAAMDIFCLPSLWEGLPIALLEAMAMRKAIVASEIDGINDLIVPMKNGLLVPVLKPELLKDAIENLVNDAGLRKELGNEAGMTVNEKYNVQLMTKNIEQTYKQVLKAEN